eukprot:6129008-Prorocentrum_lima.AAC.1
MAPRSFTLTGSTQVQTPPQSLRWRVKQVVNGKLMGPYVYMLPRTPEEIAAAGGLQDDADANAACPRPSPQWDAPDSSPRPYEVDEYSETHAPA